MHTLLEIGLTNALMATALALVAAVVSCFHRRPALTYSLWLLVLVKLVTPPLVRIPVAWEPPPTVMASAAPAADPASEPEEWFITDLSDPIDELAPSATVPPDIEEPLGADEPFDVAKKPTRSGQPDWLTLLPWVWLVSSVVWLAVAVQRSFRFHALLAHARPAPGRVQRQARRLALRLGLDECPGVWMLPGRISPMLWALGGAPRLLLPAGFWERLPEGQQETLLVHELAHVRRRDHWMRAFEVVVTSLYWWHPILWWARRELRQAEEECCDAWVVSVLPASARAYAIALVETVDFLSEAGAALPLGASGIGEVRDLKRRLTMIMRGSTPQALTWSGLLAVAGMGLVLLPVLPTWAQTPKTIQVVVSEDDEKQADKAKVQKEKAERDEDMAKAEAAYRQARENLERAQKQLKEAAERLAQAGGKARTGGTYTVTGAGAGMTITIRTPDGKTQTFTVPNVKIPEDVMKRVPEEVQKHLIEVQRKVESKLAEKKAEDAKTRPAPKTPEKASSDRTQDLEKRLDRLMQEIESLRKELRSRNPGEVRLYEFKDGQPHVFTVNPGQVHSYELKLDNVQPRINLNTIPGHVEYHLKKVEPTPKPEAKPE